MAKVMFVDDRSVEIMRQWERSGCESDHELIPLGPFISIERTCEMVRMFQPDVVLIGYGLSSSVANGADVIRALWKQGFSGRIIANSGGGTAQFERDGINGLESANRNPQRLYEMLHNR